LSVAVTSGEARLVKKSGPKRLGISTRSAGTSRNARRTVTVNDLRWADLILVMEQKHKSRIQADFRDETKFKTLHVLGIPDDFQFMDPELVEILEAKVSPLLN
jgi:predicted protein tyrosine phosphatase